MILGLSKKVLTFGQLIFARDWGGILTRLSRFGVSHFAPREFIPNKPTKKMKSKDEYLKSAHAEFLEFLSTNQVMNFQLSSRPQVSIILVLFNKAELTYLCLKSLAGSIREVDAEVIIVDNSSSDRTNELISRVKGCKVIFNKENVGFLRACNQAATLVDSDYILFLNNDAITYPGSLGVALQSIKSEKDIGAVGGRIELLDGSLQEAGNIVYSDGTCKGYGRGDLPENGEYMFIRDTDYCSGAFLLTRKDLFEKLEGFDSDFEPAYYEETDYCIRLQKMGLRIVYDPRVRIKHFEFGSSESNDSAIRLMEINRQKLLKKHGLFLSTKSKSRNSSDYLLRTPATNNPRPRMLYVDDSPPNCSLGAGFPRAVKIVNELSKSYDITIFPTLGCYISWNEIYDELPRNVEVMRRGYLVGLKSILHERRDYFNVIWISRPHNMSFYVDHCSHLVNREKTKIVYDAEALFKNRSVLEKEILGKARRPIYESKRFPETELYKVADIVTAVTDSELKSLTEGSSKKGLVIGHDLKLDLSQESFQEREGICFLGSIHGHPSPNSDAIFWFLENVYPIIVRKIPEIKIHLVGLNRLKEKYFSKYSEVLVHHGSVKDLKSCLGAFRIMVIPTRYASGIPQKAYDACSFGIPCVVTDLIAEQMYWDDNIAGIAPVNDALSFAEKCIQIYSDENIWLSKREGMISFSNKVASNHISKSVQALISIIENS